MSNTNSIKKELARAKIANLAIALELCGIEAEVEEREDGVISLNADIWNCMDGSDINVQVWASPDEDYEVDSCAQDTERVEKFFKELTDFIENF